MKDVVIALKVNTYTIYQKGFQKRISNYPKIIDKIISEKNFSATNSKTAEIANFEEKNNIYLVGDSHMQELYKSMYNSREKLSNYNLIQLNASGCYYIHGFDKIHKYKKEPEKYCDKEFQTKRRKEFLSKKNSIVIIGGRLPVYLSGERYDNGEGEREQKEWHVFKSSENQDLKDGVKESIQDLLDEGIKIILIYPIPPVGFDVTKKLFDNYRWNKENFDEFIRKSPITTSNKNFDKWAKNSYKILDSIEHNNLYRIIPQNLFCNVQIKNRCLLHDTKDVFYIDNNHLSKAGNKKIINLIFKKINLIEKNN